MMREPGRAGRSYQRGEEGEEAMYMEYTHKIFFFTKVIRFLVRRKITLLITIIPKGPACPSPS